MIIVSYRVFPYVLLFIHFLAVWGYELRISCLLAGTLPLESYPHNVSIFCLFLNVILLEPYCICPLQISFLLRNIHLSSLHGFYDLITHFLLLLDNILVCVYTTVCLSIHLLKDILADLRIIFMLICLLSYIFSFKFYSPMF
jgi:hypothetical protein